MLKRPLVDTAEGTADALATEAVLGASAIAQLVKLAAAADTGTVVAGVGLVMLEDEAPGEYGWRGTANVAGNDAKIRFVVARSLARP